MKKVYYLNVLRVLVIVLIFLPSSIKTQNFPSIKIDGNEILISDFSMFPYWLKSGHSLELGANVKLISVLQYDVVSNTGSGNDLVFEDVLLVTSAQIVPANKVWKVESVGLDMAAAIVGPTGPTGADGAIGPTGPIGPTGNATLCDPANSGETLINFSGCLYVKNIDESGTFTWANAQTQCQSLGSGWYLPGKMELDVLYQHWNQPSNGGKCYGTSCPLSGFASDNYWSSTVEDSGDAWGQRFSDGNQPYNSFGKSNSLRVRCVRR